MEATENISKFSNCQSFRKTRTITRPDSGFDFIVNFQQVFVNKT
jgi:hypothetical protein